MLAGHKLGIEDNQLKLNRQEEEVKNTYESFMNEESFYNE